MCFHFSKHVLSDSRYRKACALTSHFVLGVGGGRLPCKLSKILLVSYSSGKLSKKNGGSQEEKRQDFTCGVCDVGVSAAGMVEKSWIRHLHVDTRMGAGLSVTI